MEPSFRLDPQYYSQFYSNDRLDFEKYLESQTNRRLTEDGNVSGKNLEAAIRYSLLSSGKRIRPRLVSATSQMLRLRPEQFLPAAAAIEMVHCFTLIHDDLPCMDNDDFRRGIPTNH